jgi:hypothetical protein
MYDKKVRVICYFNPKNQYVVSGFLILTQHLDAPGGFGKASAPAAEVSPI